MPGPLEGVRVVDCTAIVSGPYSTMLLADQGADVIKVEVPGVGDLVRYAGRLRGGMGPSFAVLNRGKRSLVLDLRDERGRAILRRLVARADVFAQNFRPGAAERVGMGYEDLRRVNPELIYVSISGFGESGPYTAKRVYDPVIQALSGMAAVQADPSTRAPDLVRNIVCDKVTGLMAAQAITAALLARARGGGGQHIRLAMLDAALAFLWPDAMANETFVGAEPGLLLADFYRITRTADGFMTWYTASDREFAGLCRALERPEWASDPRFATLAERQRHLLALMPMLDLEFAKRSTQDLLRALEAEDVPCARIQSVREAVADPQVAANGAVVESEHPRAGRIREPAPAARFERTPARAGGPAPGLGEHTDEILSDLGLDAAEIAALRDAGVVA